MMSKSKSWTRFLVLLRRVNRADSRLNSEAFEVLHEGD